MTLILNIYIKKKKKENQNWIEIISMIYVLRLKTNCILKTFVSSHFFFQYDSTVAMIELVAIREEEIHL